MTKEVDDLEIITCPKCLGSKSTRDRCLACHGDGKIVRRQTKFYEWRDSRRDSVRDR
jgi:DnaJ-class molecular chaperone